VKHSRDKTHYASPMSNHQTTHTSASSMSDREATQIRASPRNNHETNHTARITVEERPFRAA
jgi:hypothetical protein